MSLAQAAKIMLELAQIPAQPKLIAAFSNYSQNSMWIKSVLAAAAGAGAASGNPYYERALKSLQFNGIPINLYSTNNLYSIN